jgi:hypothetical protein
LKRRRLVFPGEYLRPRPHTTASGDLQPGKHSTSSWGSIEVGKYADLIAISGDPLADITVMEKVSFVMKAGEVIKHATPK